MVASVGFGSVVPLVALSIPAAIVGYRAGWHAGAPLTPAAVPEAFEPAVEPNTVPQSLPEPPPDSLAEESRQWVDEVAVLERMGGSIEILMELTDLFASENVRRLAALRAAIAAGDALQTSREAHGIKSGLTNFCADEAVALAFQIEASAKKGSLDGLETATDVLEAVLNSVTEQLTMMGKAA
ncbi:MAG: Hpt domain-containing protein [Myxococcota bacterium]|nr:Hpt domain-containing protein [Myxococcota bacterium]